MSACGSKGRRRTVAAASGTRDSSSWASMHEDLVDLIAWRLRDGEDYVRFRAVCQNWRSCTASPRGRGIVDRRFHPRRWMLLPEGHGLHPGHGKLRGFVRFFNLSTGAFVRIHLPLFRDHCVLDSIDGVLLLQRDRDTAVRLLNPFTGDILDFPPMETLLSHVFPLFPGTNKWLDIRRVHAASINVSTEGVVSLMMILGADGACGRLRVAFATSTEGVVSLMMILGADGACRLRVAFATSGGQQWRVWSWYLDRVYSQLWFQGKIYVVCDIFKPTGGRVLVIDPPELKGTEIWVPPPRSVAKCPVIINKPGEISFYLCYLVECCSEVLVVAMSSGTDKKISVYRLADLMLGRTALMTCIDGNALFICGRKRNLCVSSKAFPTIVGDTIVFREGSYLAQYHLSRGTLLPASDGSILSSYDDISGPCSMIHHIYTCCYRQLWNKGRFYWENEKWRVKGKWRIGLQGPALGPIALQKDTKSLEG